MVKKLYQLCKIFIRNFSNYFLVEKLTVKGQSLYTGKERQR